MLGLPVSVAYGMWECVLVRDGVGAVCNECDEFTGV